MARVTQLLTAVLISLCSVANALPWMEDQILWNLNQNQMAADPTEYWGEWTGHEYNPSPKNWRMPFYALTADRFADGDPTNNNANGSVFEHQWQSNQFRFGGDIVGAMQSLDYLHGLGIRSRKYKETRQD
jgi:alpha-1,3-glucan synthase